ncbi:MAG TPA: UDP-N-acetylmuramoyl-L-alanine--D-glutamate ligase [Candidatus Saccharimonadales bacterium]|nr:UDP-N-acetylmuramoyl-L-alanine--D-glutamate ligase [Candidatus Saccharimonadales bacterium]
MQWSDFQDKKVALLGAGMENMSLISHLLEHRAVVTLCEQWPVTLANVYEGHVRLNIGDAHLENLDQFDYVFRSPGLPVARVDEALKDKTAQPVRTSAMDLFFALGLGVTVGVTGTKGKGTTSTMIGSILESAGRDVIVAGNIGKVIFEVLDDIHPDTVVVMELSSFQLEDISHSPHIAVTLPIVPDHLAPLSARSPNFHPTFEKYAEAKANITAFQTTTDFLVYAADSKIVQDIANNSTARRLGVGEERGDIVVEPTGEVDVGHNEMINFKELGLKGRHIYLDAALATAVARELGCDVPAIKQGLRNFQPLPHRLQTIGTFGGVTYVDDSYATAPDAAMAAIESIETPLVWIGGGSRKGAQFEDLARTVVESTIKIVVLLGEEGPRLKTAIEKLNQALPIFEAASMAEAVQLAKARAQAGDTVLLSPACASKDMFENAADRGEKFQGAVNEQL